MLHALEARLRRAGGDAHDGRAGGRRPATRLRAEAQLLRPRRGHRAVRRAPAAALRAPGGGRGPIYLRQGARLLRGRQHPHARPVQPRLQGELLQVHQRDAQRDRRGLERVPAGLAHRGQRPVRRRRLRARAGHRMDRDGRRRQHRGVAARGAAARRAARHRRPHAAGRQAQGPPRPRRFLLHDRGRRQGQARGGVGPRGRGRAALAARRDRAVARPRARGEDRSAARRARGRADAAHPHARGRPRRLRARGVRDRPAPRPRRDHSRRAGDAAAGRRRRGRRAGRRVLAAGRRPRAGRSDPASENQRGGPRALGLQNAGCGRHDGGLRPPAARPPGRLVPARGPSLPQTGAQAYRRLVALGVRVDRAGLVLHRHAARAGAGRRPLLHAGRRRRRCGPACDGEAHRRELRRLSDDQRPVAAGRPLSGRARPRRRSQGPRGPGSRRRRGGRGRARHVHARRHRLGGRGAAGARVARGVFSRRADRHGGLAALRRARDAGEQDLWPALRVAELDLPAAERRGPQGRATGLRHRRAQRFRPQESVMAGIDYLERIPNNVDLAGNRRLQRALEEWQPRFLEWWRDMGPEGYQARDVYLRTAISVDAQGWAQFGYLKMPDYRWGIFLGEPEPNRTIAFGDHKGEPAWQDVPGEYRGTLRRLIVTQGDTEPASVEQQRHLGRTCPSLYDLRNLFQINVEEGRHLWAMVYLLDAYFGRDGREESEALLQRHSGDRDKPRILGAFNEKTPDWLSYMMFTYFTDRDGKYQLASLAESGFDPLSRTCRFMLTEEAHHMFVGESGVGRIVQRTCEIMKQHPHDDPRRHGVIDLPAIQRYLNFHFSVSLDLFGSEISTNAANFYTLGLKGRFEETKKTDDHLLKEAAYRIITLQGDRLVETEQPALPTLNERLRDDYVADCQRGVDRWNRVIREHGLDLQLRLPHRGFHRAIGACAEVRVSPDGRLLSQADWDAHKREWLPTETDQVYVQNLMKPATEPGKFANWIAPPARGINGQPVDFEYVRLV